MLSLCSSRLSESTLPHGHVLAVTGMIHKLELDKLLFGKRHHLRELALALGRYPETTSPCSPGLTHPSAARQN
jgi:hypothetical protein